MNAMSTVHVLMLHAPGTNCDVETAFALQQAGAEVSLVHVSELIRGARRLSDHHMIVIPGGFTYGDDIAAGKVLANELMLKLNEQSSIIFLRGNFRQKGSEFYLDNFSNFSLGHFNISVRRHYFYPARIFFSKSEVSFSNSFMKL